jgi:S-adenosylhomocysteine hydrolase
MNHAVVLIQHLKRDTIQFARTLLNFDVKIPFIVAIPYSIEDGAIEEAASLGIKILTPDLDNLAQTALAELRALKGKYEGVIVQEVGGYLAKHFAMGEEYGPVVCVVEETKNGLWRYEEVSKSLPLPVIQVADAELKRVEAHFVGEAVCDAVASHLFKQQETMRYLRLGLIGYGDIGAGVAEAMLRRRILPLVYDIDPIKLSGALTSGCRIGSLENVLSTSDVIIGSTGKTCFKCEDLTLSDKVRYFASASSRDIEFPLEDMKKMFRSRIDGDNIKFEGSRGDLVVFMNGFPINFSFRSLPPNISDLLFLLLSAAMRNYQISAPPPGLHRLERKFEIEAAEVYLRFHPI